LLSDRIRTPIIFSNVSLSFPTTPTSFFCTVCAVRTSMTHRSSANIILLERLLLNPADNESPISVKVL